MAGFWEISALSALTLSGGAVFYVGSATSTLAENHSNFSSFAQATDTVTVPRGANQLFRLNVILDGVPTTAVLDTGATHSVISRSMLHRIERQTGRKFSAKGPRGVMRTLSGNVTYRMISIGEVKAEGINLGNLQAAMVDSSDTPAILGQDAISRFHSVTIKSDELILR